MSSGFIKYNGYKEQRQGCTKCAYHSDDRTIKGIYVRGCSAPAPNHKPCKMGACGFWAHTFTPTYRAGDKVKMFGCGEIDIHPEYDLKIWTCTTDSQIGIDGEEEVALKDFDGGLFKCKYLMMICRTSENSNN